MNETKEKKKVSGGYNLRFKMSDLWHKSSVAENNLMYNHFQLVMGLDFLMV